MEWKQHPAVSFSDDQCPAGELAPVRSIVDCLTSSLTFRRSLVEFPHNFPGVRKRSGFAWGFGVYQRSVSSSHACINFFACLGYENSTVHFNVAGNAGFFLR